MENLIIFLLYDRDGSQASFSSIIIPDVVV